MSKSHFVYLFVCRLYMSLCLSVGVVALFRAIRPSRSDSDHSLSLTHTSANANTQPPPADMRGVPRQSSLLRQRRQNQVELEALSRRYSVSIIFFANQEDSNKNSVIFWGKVFSTFFSRCENARTSIFSLQNIPNVLKVLESVVKTTNVANSQ